MIAEHLLVVTSKFYPMKNHLRVLRVDFTYTDPIHCRSAAWDNPETIAGIHPDALDFLVKGPTAWDED